MTGRLATLALDLVSFVTEPSRARRAVIKASTLWFVAALAAAAAIELLQWRIGERLEYPRPQYGSVAGLLYAFGSLVGTLWLASGPARARLALPWIAGSLVAGMCFYPFLFCGRSFLVTNFLSADWAYPFSQIQPAAGFVNPEPHDSSMLYFPLKYVWAESIREYSTFPFWDFARNSGMPFAAATLSGAFDPLNVFFVLFGVETGWGIVGLLHLLIAGSGMFLLVEALSRSRFAALFASMSFMLMPILAGWSRGIVWNATGVWLPLVCYFLYDTLQTGRARSLALGAIALAVATFGGWIQWVIYFYLLLGVLVLQWLAVQVYAGRRKQAIGGAVLFAAFVGLAIGLSAIHLGLFREVTGLQPRAPVPMAQVESIRFPYGAGANLAYLIPNLFGITFDGELAPGWSLLEYQRYLGGLCFPLIFVAFFKRDTRQTAAFFVIPLLFFLSVSTLGVGYRLLYYVVPGFDAIPVQQTRALFIIEFLLILLAALGASNLRRMIYERSQAFSWITIGGAGLYLLLALVVSRDMLALHLPEALRLAGTSRSVWLAAGLLAIGLASAPIPARGSMVAVFAFAVQCGVMTACAGELILLRHKLASFSSPLVTDQPPIVSEIKAAGNNRIFRTGGLIPTHAFIHNTGALFYGLNDTMAHDSVYLESYAKFFSLFNPKTDYHHPSLLLTPESVTRSNVDLVRMLNVDYIFHKEAVTGTTADPATFDASLLTHVRKDGGRHVLRLKNPLPRAFFVERAAYLPEAELMARMRSEGFDPTSTAYVASDVVPHAQSGEASAQAALAVPPTHGVIYADERPNSFSVRYSSASIQPMFISNVFYPGWSAAFDDGRELVIHKANLAFMLVFAPPANDARITFTFQPSQFPVYLLVSAAALAIALWLLLSPVAATRAARQLWAGPGFSER